jgi:hypothetical protein
MIWQFTPLGQPGIHVSMVRLSLALFAFNRRSEVLPEGALVSAPGPASAAGISEFRPKKMRKLCVHNDPYNR